MARELCPAGISMLSAYELFRQKADGKKEKKSNILQSANTADLCRSPPTPLTCRWRHSRDAI
jgi:hypothetical protein